jgi:hypothetical protein
MEFGTLFLAPAAVVATLVVRRPEVRRSAFGASTGVGLVALFVAYLNRQGSGFTCWHTALASGCDQHLNPWPWVATGVVLVVVGIAGQVVHNRSSR